MFWRLWPPLDPKKPFSRDSLPMGGLNILSPCSYWEFNIVCYAWYFCSIYMPTIYVLDIFTFSMISDILRKTFEEISIINHVLLFPHPLRKGNRLHTVDVKHLSCLIPPRISNKELSLARVIILRSHLNMFSLFCFLLNRTIWVDCWAQNIRLDYIQSDQHTNKYLTFCILYV